MRLRLAQVECVFKTENHMKCEDDDNRNLLCMLFCCKRSVFFLSFIIITVMVAAISLSLSFSLSFFLCHIIVICLDIAAAAGM